MTNWLWLFVQKAYAFKIMMDLEEAREIAPDCEDRITDLGGGLVDVPSECLEVGHFEGLIGNFISLFFTSLIPVSIIVLIWGAYQYLTAYGNEQKAQKGKTVILWAIIGLVVAFLARIIVHEFRRVTETLP